MSFDRFPPAIHLEPDAAMERRTALRLHSIALPLLALLPLPAVVRLGLLAGWGLSLYYSLRRYPGRCPTAISLSATGSWRLRLRDGSETSARLIGGQRLPALLWLDWGTPAGRRTVALTGSSSAQRRLRARLRLGEGTGDEQAG